MNDDFRIPPGWHDGELTPEQEAEILRRFREQLARAFPVNEDVLRRPDGEKSN